MNDHNQNEGEWTKVTRHSGNEEKRKNRGMMGTIWRDHTTEVRRPITHTGRETHAGKGVNGKIRGASVFVDNLPKFYDNYLLQNLFPICGKVKDSYIPGRTRVNKNTKYGFICFEKEDEAFFVIKKMNGENFFGNKIVVMASHKRGSREEVWRVVPRSNGSNKVFDMVKSGKTYAEAVGTSKQVWVKKQNPSSSKGKTELITTDSEGEGERTRFYGTANDHYSDIQKTQQKQEIRIKELEKVCMDLQNEVNSWKSLKKDRLTNQYSVSSKEGENSESKNKSIGSSKVPETNSMAVDFQSGTEMGDIEGVEKHGEVQKNKER